MSESNIRKPRTREELIRLLSSAARKELEQKRKQRTRSMRATVSGVAKVMKLHRDTIYEWMKEFGVRFEEISAEELDFEKATKKPKNGTYLIGEALMGEGNEVAHVDLIIGDKDGPVGQAFAQGLSNLSVGHTPLLAVIRPNLPPKPHTLLIPKVTVKNLNQAEKIFGPAQAGVAKAVADAVEDGIIPEDKLDDWLIISSVFVHPQAQDYRRIYQYNYGATKLALKRALTRYPSWQKIAYDKDRAKHPIMGFKVPRLWRPPYLQIALDVPSLERTKKVLRDVPRSDRIILEVGTPLLKKYGVKVIRELRETAKEMFIVADLKTLDVGKVEVDLAFEETADAVVASGLAATETLNTFIYEAKRVGIYSIIDMMNVEDPIRKLQCLKEFPEVIILHRGIDTEGFGESRWELIKELRQAFKDRRFLLAVAGGITPEISPEAFEEGADIIIVGRYITQSKDVKRSVREFLESNPKMKQDIDLLRVHVE